MRSHRIPIPLLSFLKFPATGESHHFKQKDSNNLGSEGSSCRIPFAEEAFDWSDPIFFARATTHRCVSRHILLQSKHVCTSWKCEHGNDMPRLLCAVIKYQFCCCLFSSFPPQVSPTTLSWQTATSLGSEGSSFCIPFC